MNLLQRLVLFSSSPGGWAGVASGLIGRWELEEGTGTAVLDSSDQGNDGVLAAGGAAPTWVTNGLSFDGGDAVNIYSAGLNADFDGAELTLEALVKVSAVGIWTDATARYVAKLAVDGSNVIDFRRGTIDNQLRFEYAGGGTLKLVNISTSRTDVMHIAITASASGDEMKAYVDGAQTGATQTGLGTWAGALSVSQCVIGATLNTGSQGWSGTVYAVRLWNRALSAAEVLQEYNLGLT